MQRDAVSCQGLRPWESIDATKYDARSSHILRLMELAHTLAAAETAVLTGDGNKALADLKRLQNATLHVVSELELHILHKVPGV